MDLAEIEELSDAQLRSKLKEHDVKMGPVGRNKKLFQKRLFKLVNGYEYGKKPGSSSASSSKSPSRIPTPSRQKSPARKTTTTATKNVIASSNNFSSSTPKNNNIPKEKTNLDKVQNLIKNSPKSPNVTHTIDFEKLTNQEIRALIRRNGSVCGPIPNASIRKLMINKLKRMESEKGGLNRKDPEIGSGDAPSSRTANIIKNNVIEFSSADEEEETDTPLLPRSKKVIENIPVKTVKTNGKSVLDKFNKIIPPPASPITNNDFSATEDEDNDEVHSPVSNFSSNTPPRTAWGQEMSSVYTSFTDNEMQLEQSTNNDLNNQNGVNDEKLNKSLNYARKRRSFARLSAGHELANTTQQNFDRKYLDETHFEKNNEEESKSIPAQKPTLLEQHSNSKNQASTSKFSKFVNILPKIFFIVFAIILYSIFQNSQGTENIVANSITCDSSDPGNCMNREELDEATFSALNKIHKQLNEVAMLDSCGETNQDPKMNLVDLVQTLPYDTTSKIIDNVLVQFFRHPNFGVSIFDSDDKMVKSESQIRKQMVKSLLIAEPIGEHEKCKFKILKAKILEKVWSDKVKFYSE